MEAQLKQQQQQQQTMRIIKRKIQTAAATKIKNLVRMLNLNG